MEVPSRLDERAARIDRGLRDGDALHCDLCAIGQADQHAWSATDSRTGNRSDVGAIDGEQFVGAKIEEALNIELMSVVGDDIYKAIEKEDAERNDSDNYRLVYRILDKETGETIGEDLPFII